MRMKLSDIIINKSFTETTPNEKKMIECREFWRYEGKQDRPIVLNKKNMLVDGYIQYLILVEHKEEYAEVTYTKKHNRRYERLPKVEPTYKNIPTTYIYGVHPNSYGNKEYTWRVPVSWEGWSENLQIGDTIMCSTKHGIAPVIITKIERLDKCPTEHRISKVCSKEIRRNGAVVEF